MTFKIQKASVADLKRIEDLLQLNNLPIADIHEPVVQLFAGYLGDELLGSIGIEQYGNIGLLRSLAVKDGYKAQRFGEKLLAFLLDFCSQQKISELYLLTTTADSYFERFGFGRISRSDAPAEIVQTREFKDICPASAVVMLKVF